MTYEETMAYGAREYADVLQALRTMRLPPEFIQTGGMNAAITVTLEAGFYLLITDRDDALSWERAMHVGWYVGLYPPDEGSQPIRWVERDGSDLAALIEAVEDVLASRC